MNSITFDSGGRNASSSTAARQPPWQWPSDFYWNLMYVNDGVRAHRAPVLSTSTALDAINHHQILCARTCFIRVRASKALSRSFKDFNSPRLTSSATQGLCLGRTRQHGRLRGPPTLPSAAKRQRPSARRPANGT